MLGKLYFSKVSLANSFHQAVLANVWRKLIRSSTSGGYPRVGVVIGMIINK
uniref:Uncharacterized protein n=1 Tax=Octopus bimaculoides TaxID=37653 RepID=A0A0L8G1N7_OCTBM